MSTVLRLALAGLGGLAAAAAFEPLAWAVLLPPAVASLAVALHGLCGRRAFAVGMAFGLAFMAALLPWIQVIGVDAWIGLSVLEATFFGVLGVALTRVATLPGWPLWAAACWVAVELLRSLVPWGGFPWGRLAFATVDTPLAPLMGIVGTSGATFVVALIGSTVAWLVLGGHRRPTTASAVAVGVAAIALTPALVAGDAAQFSTGTAVRVAAVQGNVPGEGMDAFSERRAVLDNHVGATLALADRVATGQTEQPDFVLWPENSTDIDPFGDPTVHADIQRAADAIEVPILVGAMVDGEEPGDVRNECIVWEPGTGPGQRYAKTHPVPFGEYIPMRDQLAKLFERLDQIPRDMVPGTEPGVLDLAGTTVGDVICFEVAYDGLVRDVVDGGAQLLVVQTNNATYMGTGQVEQQFAIARLRAIETSRYVVVVATNGVSGIIAPDGSVVERADVRETVVIEEDVPLRTVTTLGVRFGRWVEVTLVAVAVGALIAAVLRGRRTSRPGHPDAPDRPQQLSQASS